MTVPEAAGRPPQASTSLRIGTRGSALALTQARAIADALGGELVPITNPGDRDRALPDKVKWVAGIEQALLEGEIDLAVHSAKDVPTELPDGLVLLPSPARANARDALCGATSLAALPDGARIGTSSLRRAAQLLALRPDLDIAELRGNIDTRLGRLATGDFDAIVLAAAGLERLGRAAEGHPLGELLPAAGQGTLALEARADRSDVREAVVAAGITDAEATAALRAERALVHGLGADCHTPVAAWARPTGALWHVEAFVGRADGSAWLRDELHGPDPEALGAEVAARLLTAGAREILEG